MTDVVDGTPSTKKLMDEVRSNFILANYQSEAGLDTDDGAWGAGGRGGGGS